MIAEWDVRCLRVDRKDLETITKNRPEIAFEIWVVLVKRLLAVREGLDADAKSVSA